jgi:CheY-like chemotaxis protein/HPt (histidine-containing phosphotransfer) domain-containing protein
MHEAGSLQSDRAEPNLPQAASAAGLPLRLLLAEDNKINQQFVVALLAKAGQRTDVAENGHQAVDAVRRTAYDAVLMDVQMPQLDGVEATKQIRALPPPACLVYIIALTANAMQGARAEYLTAGMDDYISKPIDGKLLLTKLANLSAKKKSVARAPVGHGGSEPWMDGKTPFVPDLPVLDPAKLADLKAIMSAPEIVEFITLFLAETATHLAQIEDHRASGDLSSAARVAHGLVSMTGNIGAMELSALSREFETSCKSGNAEAVESLALELSTASAKVTKALAARLEGSPNQGAAAKSGRTG